MRRNFLPLRYRPVPSLSLLPSVGTAWLILFSAASNLSAQPVYVRDIALPVGHNPILRTDAVIQDRQYLTTTSQVYYRDVRSLSTWTLALSQFGTDISAQLGSEVAGPASSGGDLFMTGARLALYDLNLTTLSLQASVTVTGVQPSIGLSVNQGLSLAMLSGDRIFSINLANGGAAAALTTAGTGLGHLYQAQAGGMTFGPNGLVYVLDNPANDHFRIQSFSFIDGSVQSTFNIAAGLLPTGPAGMAISPSGRIYIGDGVGGGLAYDLLGNSLGAFSPPAPDPSNPFNPGTGGVSYVSVDTVGGIYVYDRNSGLHQYADISAIPEPTTYAAILGVCAFGVVGSRWRKKRRMPVA
jgi:hypothetical protein